MRARTTTSIGKKVTTALLALAMALGLAPGVALAEEVGLEPQAGGKTVACLGTSGIAVAQDGKWVAGGGSYVYYGTYDGAPTRYRVLANGTTDFTGEGEPTMLLDCDAVLATTAYGTTRAWGTSSVKVWATGDAFLTKEGNFTAPEKAAIAQSATSRAGELEPDDATTLGKDFRLNGEQAFVLSVGEASGYYADNNARKKNGGDGVWWLRTAGSDPSDTCAAIVYDGGYVYSFGYPVRSAYIGVSPVFNIDLKSVIFSSLISGVAGQSGAEYKLTIKDAGLGASGTAALKGTKATVTYATTDGASQASYIITDAAWDNVNGCWPADAQALAYGRLGDADKGKGTFELPKDCTADGWGSAYHVYVLAESVSAGNATDYASAPAEVEKLEPVATPTFDPAAGAYTSGQSVTIGCATEGATVRYTTDGTEPTRDSAAYAGPIAVSTSTTIKAVASKEGMLDSEVAEARYEIAVPVETHRVTVTADPAEGGTAKAEPAEAPAGATVKLAATPADGWEFAGWTATTQGVTIKGNAFEMTNSDVAVKARFTKKTEPAPKPQPGPTPGAVALTGSGHVQTYGDVAARASGKGISIGTTGEAKRLERFSLALPGDADGGIEYRAHLQGKGWAGWSRDGAPCGTAGEARRMEAVQVRLTGALAKTHSVWYRVHSQTWGWLGWAADGQAAGTAGQAKRAEAVEVQLLPKGQTPSDYVDGQASYVGAVAADVHLQGTGWTGTSSALEFGTTGQARRLEAVRLSVPNQPAAGGVSYEVHAQRIGWMPAASDGGMAGTEGQARRLEAVRVSLTGDVARGFSVWYRVHSQSFGWLGWAHDGEEAGTTGLGKRAEAIDVQVLPQGQVPRGYDASKAACVTK